MRSLVLLVAMVGMFATTSATIGCSSSNSAPHGSPVLTNVYWIAAGQRTLVWSAGQADGGLGVVAPPAGQEVDFVFDRRLDGSKIESTVTYNGVSTQVPVATPPITVSWTGGADSVPPFSAQVLYNSEPFYGGSTSFVFMRLSSAGFPSSNTVVFALDKTALTSAYNEPMIGPDQVAVATGPLTAAVHTLSTADAASVVPTSFMVPIVFSNRVSAAAVAPFVHATSGGSAVAVTVTANASDPTVVYATASCAAGWPTTGPVTVSVDSGTPDAFGGPLATPASGTFTAAGTGPSGDGGC
jgi:hypothetical protein